MIRYSWLCVIVLLAGCGDEVADIKPQPLPVETTSDLMFEEPAAVPDGVRLRLEPTDGASVVSDLVGEIDVWAVPGKTSIGDEALGRTRMFMDYTISVASADPGSVTLTFASSPLRLEGKADGVWERLGEQTSEIRFDRRASLLEDPSNLFEGLFGAGMVMFPESPIAAGSTWSSTNTRDMPPFGAVEVSETFTYMGTENKDGMPMHRIDSQATGSLEGMTIEATYFIREDGLPHSASIRTTATAPVMVRDDGTPLWAGFTVNVEITPKKKG